MPVISFKWRKSIPPPSHQFLVLKTQLQLDTLTSVFSINVINFDSLFNSAKESRVDFCLASQRERVLPVKY